MRRRNDRQETGSSPPGIAARVTLVLVSTTLLVLASCRTGKETERAGAEDVRCTYALESIDNFRLAGVPLYSKTSLDVNDATETLGSFARGEMPASFVLNVTARRSDTAGTPEAVTLVSFPWTLYIDDVPTIEGDIPQAMKLPAGHGHLVIPLWMKLDLLRFFKASRYEKLVDLAFALGGAHGSTARLKLRVKPVMRDASGELAYPQEVEIAGTKSRE